MTAAWMTYAIVVAGVLGVAAWLADRAVRLSGGASRFVWIGAVAGSVAWPALAWTRVRFGLISPGATTPPGEAAPLEFGALQSLIDVPLAPPPFWHLLDGPLLLGWAVTSLALGVVLVGTHRRIRRESRAWPKRHIHAVPVRVTPSLGPAVIGWVRSTIVIPGWVQILDSEWQRLVILHEREHLRARDSMLALAGVAGVVLFPWNPVIWWQHRRLRNAIELDCDRRVLRAGADPATYGALLLEVASRARPARLGIVAMSTPRSFLARRINTMTKRLPRAPRLHATVAAAAAVAVVAVGCEAPMPAAIAIDQETGAMTTLDRVFTVEEVDAPPERLTGPRLRYPEMLRQAGIEGHVDLSFVIDESGTVDTTSIEVTESTNLAFVAPARHAVSGGSYTPAKIAGEAVSVAVQQRIAFSISSREARTRQLRGASELRLGDSGVAPLVLLDGEVIANDELPGLSPDTIERVEVLKGEAALRLFGERGKNGVIQIFTKG